MVGESILVAEALVGPEYRSAGPSEIHLSGGRITGLTAAPEGIATKALALPAPVNAHDHARPLSATSFGLAGEPLETWLVGLGVMPPVDAGLAARAALSRAALGGVGAIMVHLTRPMGLVPLEEEALQIADAADEIGVRIALAISLRDKNPLIYGDHDPVLNALSAQHNGAAAQRLAAALDRPMPSIEAQIATVERVAKTLSGRKVDVQFGPTGPQWCSPELLEAVAHASARTGRRIHMHLLETRYQRAWADHQYPTGLVAMLQRIGFLSPRLTLAHGTWAQPDELEMIAASGATIAVNTSSNLHLKSGIAPVAAMKTAGVRIAMGIDGCAFDEDDDALREVRLMRALHAGHGFDDGLTPSDALEAACMTGRSTLGLSPGGRLEAGAAGDILLLDLEALDRDALLPIDPRALLIMRARREHILGLWVDGRPVISQRRLIGIDATKVEADLRTAYREALPQTAQFRSDWQELRPALATWYRDRMGCC